MNNKMLYRLEIRGITSNPDDVDRWECLAETPKDFVQALRNSSFAESEDVFDYMNGFAERAYEMDSHYIRSSSCEEFVEDLVSVGYLTISEVN
jgi:hypothetical protein